MSPEEIKEILDKHQLWLHDKEGGERADLSYCNLSGCDLSGSNLRYCNLRYCNLRGCNLRGCNLSGSNLRGSNLSGSNLRGCNLSGCDLRGCNKIIGIGPIGNEKRIVYAIQHEKKVMFQAGCHWGAYEETKEAVVKKYGEESTYAKAIDIMYEQLKP